MTIGTTRTKRAAAFCSGPDLHPVRTVRFPVLLVASFALALPALPSAFIGGARDLLRPDAGLLADTEAARW